MDRSEAKAVVKEPASEEWQAFYNGYLSGLTVYAREMGHSTLKRENELLRRLMDDAARHTIEAFERIHEQAQSGPKAPGSGQPSASEPPANEPR